VSVPAGTPLVAYDPSGRSAAAGSIGSGLVAVPTVRHAFSLLSLASAARPAAEDDHYFPETGYRVASPAIWDFFTHRGGLTTFGYPVSREFRFQGFTVQFFQRRIVQLDQNGSPRLLNVLDPGLLPFSSFNGANLPPFDPVLVAASPSASDGTSILTFVRAHTSDSFENHPVDFGLSFWNTVSRAAAFPSGGDVSLLPGFDLEMWGIPTSAPAFDPNNHSVVYQRFQRGVMMYDASCRCTEGVLLADYLKSVLTGLNLPPDLAAEANGSPLFRQYDSTRPGWVHDPGRLPDTDLTNAFVPG
jgi:hypothetical protein